MDLLIPVWAGQLGGVIAGIVAIGWAVIQAYNGGFSATEKQKDQASKDLVTILQTTVDTLKTDMTKMQADHIENVKQIAGLRGENDTLMKILQGRDDAYLRFQQEGFAAFRRTEDIFGSIDRLTNLLEKHFDPTQK